MISSEKIPLLVVGGGIGGLAVAMAAGKAGYRVHVIEKAEEFAEIGAGLQLAPNAMRMLDRLGIYDEVCKNAVLPKRLVLKDAVSGQQICFVDLGNKFVDHFGYPYILVHRGDLLSAELAACHGNDRITLESKKEAIFIEDLQDGARVTCSDGSVYECAALVGADGLWSRVRKFVNDDEEEDPICSHFVAYRGSVPIEDAPKDIDPESMTVWVAPNIHFVQYLVSRGKVLNQVAVFKSNQYLEDDKTSDSWGTAEELDQYLSKLCPQLKAAKNILKMNRRWPMFDRLPIPNWTRNNITLLGDAAHPMLQYLAQGACQALEDAVCLGQCLHLNGDANQAFLSYQTMRIERTSSIQHNARLIGEIGHAHGIATILRNELLSKRSPDDFEYFETLYSYKGCCNSELLPVCVPAGEFLDPSRKAKQIERKEQSRDTVSS